MKVTKYEHSTLVISSDDALLVIDPGMFLTPPDFTGTVAVVITHEHADHWNDQNLTAILEKAPDAKVYGPAGVAAAASGFEVNVVKAGDVVTVEPFTLEFFGEKHAVIHESLPVADNVGVLVNDELYYGGDSYTVPGKPVGTLAAPVGAPWLKIGDVDGLRARDQAEARLLHPRHDAVGGGQEHGERPAQVGDREERRRLQAARGRRLDRPVAPGGMTR